MWNDGLVWFENSAKDLIVDLNRELLVAREKALCM